MIINIILRTLSIFQLGRRYLRTLQVERKAIKHNRANYYAQAWEHAAAQINATIEPLGDKGMFRITKNDRSILVFEQYTPLTDSIGFRLIVNKAIVYELLEKIGVPLPKYLHLKKMNYSSAKKFMAEMNGPIVVKPAYGTGAGAGVTTNVLGNYKLFKALTWSRAFCPETILEQQIRGDNYRLLYLDGELIDCIIRRPPNVIGDGKSNIKELIVQENKLRIKPGSQLAQDLIYLDLDTKNTLASQNMNLRTIPAKGQLIKLKDVINCNRGEDNETPEFPPAESIVSLGKKISKSIGVRLIGIDLITKDITSDLETSGGCIIEVNTPPGHYYHHIRKGNGYEVGLHLLKQLFNESLTKEQVITKS